MKEYNEYIKEKILKMKKTIFEYKVYNQAILLIIKNNKLNNENCRKEVLNYGLNIIKYYREFDDTRIIYRRIFIMVNLDNKKIIVLLNYTYITCLTDKEIEEIIICVNNKLNEIKYNCISQLAIFIDNNNNEIFTK
jgi:hypothetical protein